MLKCTQVLPHVPCVFRTDVSAAEFSFSFGDKINEFLALGVRHSINTALWPVKLSQRSMITST